MVDLFQKIYYNYKKDLYKTRKKLYNKQQREEKYRKDNVRIICRSWRF